MSNEGKNKEIIIIVAIICAGLFGIAVLADIYSNGFYESLPAKLLGIEAPYNEWTIDVKPDASGISAVFTNAVISNKNGVIEKKSIISLTDPVKITVYGERDAALKSGESIKMYKIQTYYNLYPYGYVTITGEADANNFDYMVKSGIDTPTIPMSEIERRIAENLEKLTQQAKGS